MTPFMTRVAEFVGTPADEVPQLAERRSTLPETRISRRVATGTGADRHVALRSLAEQYVCEANAVLGADHDHLDLVDEPLPNELAFTVTFRDHGARCSTTFADGRAFGRLVGDLFDEEEARELEGPDALPDLLVQLMEAGMEATPTTSA
ncbi:hypothetical protein O9K63_12540 [Janibacter cremeus]|uniref:hypothetical protein n=1 Tax=Janibacter cremeus TaxID=1285192 RepID=UPI0023F6AA0A|nr:hypothetical protein [Janibacter cremeus]WEV77415.1 hypothetical protein O9K63_12540 [Janibacter cremeus]